MHVDKLFMSISKIDSFLGHTSFPGDGVFHAYVTVSCIDTIQQVSV